MTKQNADKAKLTGLTSGVMFSKLLQTWVVFVDSELGSDCFDLYGDFLSWSRKSG
jgi:hypothetical protein